MITTTLVKNKALGPQRGFVDTFNWIVRCLKNLTGGQGCKVNWVTDDTPMIDVDMYECGNAYDDGEGGTLPDADIPAASYTEHGQEEQRSIQTYKVKDSGNPDDEGFDVQELYGFHDTSNTQDITKTNFAENYDFVVRDKENRCVKYGHVTGLGDTTFRNASGNSITGDDFTITSASNSNVDVQFYNDNGVKKIQLGVYYI